MRAKRHPRVTEAIETGVGPPFVRRLTIEWGQCDPAGIVYYPRYFEMFDGATAHMLAVATGLKKFDLLARHGAVGWPMVKTDAEFFVPSRFGDEVRIETMIDKIGRSSFEVTHRAYRGDVLSITAHETRVWAGRDATDPNRIRAAPLPDDVVIGLRRGGPPAR